MSSNSWVSVCKNSKSFCWSSILFTINYQLAPWRNKLSLSFGFYFGNFLFSFSPFVGEIFYKKKINREVSGAGRVASLGAVVGSAVRERGRGRWGWRKSSIKSSNRGLLRRRNWGSGLPLFIFSDFHGLTLPGFSAQAFMDGDGNDFLCLDRIDMCFFWVLPCSFKKSKSGTQAPDTNLLCKIDIKPTKEIKTKSNINREYRILRGSAKDSVHRQQSKNFTKEKRRFTMVFFSLSLLLSISHKCLIHTQQRVFPQTRERIEEIDFTSFQKKIKKTRIQIKPNLNKYHVVPFNIIK